MKILFLPKYTQMGASSRYRSYQYFSLFQVDGIRCFASPFFSDAYIKILYGKRKKFHLLYILPFCLLKRIAVLFTAWRYDLLVIEKELIPYFPSLFEWMLKIFKIKFIVDFDDAIFHNYDKSSHWIVRFLLSGKIPKVIRYANHVITGSPYLTKFALQYNTAVSEIPTSIPLKKYEQAETHLFNHNFVLGWIGSKSTSSNLLLIKDVLTEFCRKYSDVVIQFVGVDEKTADILGISPIQWSEKDELQLLNSFTVGIMPLVDNPFNRGKCGFKLIQYMACGKPTISTPLETNIKINRNGKNLHATTNEEWLQAFEQVYNNRAYFSEVGNENKQDVAQYYSIEMNQITYKSIFQFLLS